jgi:hypothetical protein
VLVNPPHLLILNSSKGQWPDRTDKIVGAKCCEEKQNRHGEQILRVVGCNFKYSHL